MTSGLRAERYVRFPPSARGVWVPTHAATAAAAGVAMFGPSRPATRVVQAGGWLLATIGASWALPGRRSVPEVLDRREWSAVASAVEATVGPIEAVAVAVRQQASRPGFAFVATCGRQPVAFVRAQPDRGVYAREADVLEAVTQFRPTTFTAPSLVATGVADGWEWIASTALPPRLHRPDLRAPVESVTAEIAAALASVVEVPRGAVPMHGDLAPWNLRRLGASRVLFDWEEAAAGPPGADLVYYAVTTAAVTGRRPSGSAGEYGAAVQHWIDVIGGRAAHDADRALADTLLAHLRSLRSG